MSLTTDPTDPRLKRGADDTPVQQQEVYLVLSDDERAKGFLQPVRTSYRHTVCGAITTMGRTIAETYARDPWFYGGTFCVTCSKHRPLTEFRWTDGSPMAPHEWDEATLEAVLTRRAELDAGLRKGGAYP